MGEVKKKRPSRRKNHQIVVSFVHGYNKTDLSKNLEPVPALWEIRGNKEKIHRYVFTEKASDFNKLPYEIVGEGPVKTSGGGAKIPRFGFTGLQVVGGDLLAASWRGIYRIDLKTFEVKNFITNRYASHLHGFYADEKEIIVAVPMKDMLVRMDHSGNVRDVVTVDRSLNINRYDKRNKEDWRFTSKMLSGGSGFFHFNNVIKNGDEIYVTCRHLCAFMVFKPGAKRASLRTVNYCTPTCVHDGDRFRGKYYLTSIDGKVLVASEPPKMANKEHHYDLQGETVRLGEGERNWCRGMKVTNDFIYTTVDGRYGTDLSFSVLALNHKYKEIWQKKLKWSEVDSEKDLRFVTGFDIETLSKKK
jgi:hypothetical protein